MAVIPVTFHKVTCDEPGCTTETGDLGDYGAWADHGDALSDWECCGGVVTPSDMTFCESHALAHFCDDCGEVRDHLTALPGGVARLCKDCLGEPSDDFPSPVPHVDGQLAMEVPC